MNKSHSPSTRLLTVASAAERLAVKPATIRAWILRREKLEVVRVGRCVRITEASVQALIDRNRFPPRETRGQYEV